MQTTVFRFPTWIFFFLTLFVHCMSSCELRAAVSADEMAIQAPADRQERPVATGFSETLAILPIPENADAYKRSFAILQSLKVRIVRATQYRIRDLSDLKTLKQQKTMLQVQCENANQEDCEANFQNLAADQFLKIESQLIDNDLFVVATITRTQDGFVLATGQKIWDAQENLASVSDSLAEQILHGDVPLRDGFREFMLKRMQRRSEQQAQQRNKAAFEKNVQKSVTSIPKAEAEPTNAVEKRPVVELGARDIGVLFTIEENQIVRVFLPEPGFVRIMATTVEQKRIQIYPFSSAQDNYFASGWRSIDFSPIDIGLTVRSDISVEAQTVQFSDIEYVQK